MLDVCTASSETISVSSEPPPSSAISGATPSPGPPGEPESAPTSRNEGSPRLLRHILETELENALQVVFTVRQDLSEHLVSGADQRSIESAMKTLHGLLASLRVLLAVLRAFGPSDPDETGVFDRTASGFAVLRPDGEVLYMNAEVTRIVRRDHRTVAATSFGERSWTDREQMRRHLDAAFDTGRADDLFDVVRGDGRTIQMRLHTERLDVDGDAVLLMTHVPD